MSPAGASPDGRPTGAPAPADDGPPGAPAPADGRPPGALGAPAPGGVDAERLQKSLARAFRVLGRRDRTRAQVRETLARREDEAAVVDAALGELEALGYLDDRRFAARYVEDRRTLEGWGPARLRQGLARAGVPRADAEAALAADDGPPPHELALGLLERRLAGRELPDDDRERQRALRFLVGRGHPLELAYDVVRAYEAGERATGADPAGPLVA